MCYIKVLKWKKNNIGGLLTFSSIPFAGLLNNSAAGLNTLAQWVLSISVRELDKYQF